MHDTFQSVPSYVQESSQRYVLREIHIFMWLTKWNVIFFIIYFIKSKMHVYLTIKNNLWTNLHNVDLFRTSRRFVLTKQSHWTNLLCRFTSELSLIASLRKVISLNVFSEFFWLTLTTWLADFHLTKLYSESSLSVIDN